jgi:cytochrome P450
MTDLRTELTGLIQNPSARPHASEVYRRLVTEAPVLDMGRVWAISGYDEIMAVLMHPGVTVNPANVGLALPRTTRLAEIVAAMLPMRDGADHTRLRRLATVAFSARRVAAIRSQMLTTIDTLLEPWLAASEFDFVADVAVPLPVAISCEILDIPAADRDRVTQWAGLVARSLLDPHISTEGFGSQFAEFCEYVEWLCIARARKPGEDLISQLVAARSAGTIDADELLAFVVMLFANGLETLTSGLAVAVWQLLQRPELTALIRERAEAAEPIFDECLRLGSPVRASARAVGCDVSLGEITIPAGSVAILLYVAANLDPRRFAEPDRFDPARTDGRHLAFGYGPHHCLGAPLSMMAGAGVLRRLSVENLSTDVTPQTALWSQEFAFGGLKSLPVTCHGFGLEDRLGA